MNYFCVCPLSYIQAAKNRNLKMYSLRKTKKFLEADSLQRMSDFLLSLLLWTCHNKDLIFTAS